MYDNRVENISSGIAVKENEHESYIYVCGIDPCRTIRIDKNTTLEPVTPVANPDDMIDCFMKNGNGDEFQMGILISTLRLVTAQLKITSDDPEELAILTWNAQGVCVQISALLNCDVSWYFQANTSADKFNSHTRVSMIYPNMYPFPKTLITLDESQCCFLEQSILTALQLEEHPEYANASNALWCYRIHFRPAVQLSVIWGGIESLFLIENKIKSRLSLAASRFLYGDDSAVEHIKLLYKEARCKAVHEFANGEDTLFQQSIELLHELICMCVKKNAIPDVSQLLIDQ